MQLGDIAANLKSIYRRLSKEAGNADFDFPLGSAFQPVQVRHARLAPCTQFMSLLGTAPGRHAMKHDLMRTQ